MSFILDTCAVSELRKPKPDAGFLSWFNDVSETDLFVSAITLGEIEYGIGLLETGRNKDRLMSWFEKVKESFGPRTLPVNAKVALRWGELRSLAKRKGLSIPVVDGLLAATAIECDYLFITRNVGDFNGTGAKVFSPWN
ncbi:MAG: type II toxin-antitoxin system VapC family toxin [Candidatus Lindowbacteria bacterium]|nr:type II toxin-antitoxin system VapC family toxin [Candidatus Lindowbacteria bacterium]